MTEKKSRIEIHVQINAKLFRHFAMFDAFIRRRRWQPPTLFAGIFLFFALAAYLMRGRSPQATMLAGVLLGVGIVLPAVYLGSYLFSVRAQIKKMKLDKPRAAYTLTLDDNGVEVSAGKNAHHYEWESLYAAYRRPECTYLYVSPGQAYLLPHAQLADGPEALWELLTQKMANKTLHAGRWTYQKSPK